MELSLQSLLRTGNGESVKCLNIEIIKTYANGFISSYEVLKSMILVIFAYQNLCKWFISSYEALKRVISVTFAHVDPDRSFDLQGCETLKNDSNLFIG